MGRTYAQAPVNVWDISTSLIAASSLVSASFACEGYARLVGMAYSDASMSGACGIWIQQSGASTPNWDMDYKSALSACSGSGFSIEIVGRYARIGVYTGATCAASALRSYWTLRPI